MYWYTRSYDVWIRMFLATPWGSLIDFSEHDISISSSLPFTISMTNII